MKEYKGLGKVDSFQDKVLCQVTDELFNNGWTQDGIRQFWNTSVAKDGRTAIQLLGDDEIQLVIRLKDEALRASEKVRNERSKEKIQ